nr:BPTI/Kunitz-type proteinase inhibitor domain-containing protein [uncultured Allomuricauda sp.]
MFSTIYRWTLKLVLVVVILNSCSDDDKISACQLEPDPGPCEALIPRYYFDKEDQECKEFFWGGCNGVVPFETMEACQTCESN